MIVSVFAFCLAFINTYGQPVLNVVASLIIVPTMVSVLYSGKLPHLIFAGIVFVAIIIICEFFPLAITAAIVRSDVYSIVNITIQDIGFCFISTGVFFVITMVTKFLLCKLGLFGKPIKKTLNITLLPLPILSIAIVYYIFFTSRIARLTDEMIVGSIAIVFCLLIVNIIVFTSDYDTRKKHQYRAQITEMRIQSEMRGEIIEQQNKHIADTNALVHDFKNQLLALQRLAAEQSADIKSSKLTDYIGDALQSLPFNDGFSEIRCEALRCILINTKKACAAHKIDFETQIAYDDFDFMSFQDICTIFSNALDNAIRACTDIANVESKTEILLKTRRMNHMVSIQIQNTKANSILEQNNVILTTKADTSRHGIGLPNIKHAVEKYEGSIATTYDSSTFYVDILIPIN